MPKVDVAIPCYNYGRFLDASVRSVVAQSMGDLRVLIIDDSSSDDSLQVARKLAEEDPRVSVIAHTRNRGHINTYQEGIEWASADYFLLLSADDMLVPGALERATAVMDANRDVVLTYGKCIIWPDELPMPKVDPQQSKIWSRQEFIRDTCEYGGCLVSTSTAIVRTSVQKAIGGYRASLPHSADMEMWMRFAAHGAVVRLAAVQGIYRKHSSNMSSAYYDRDLPDMQQRKAAFDSFFREYGDRVADSQILREHAVYSLAEKAYWCGIIQLCRGHIDSGRHLLRFSLDLAPSLRYRPPVRRGPSAFADAAGRLLGRGNRALFRYRRALVSLLKA